MSDCSGLAPLRNDISLSIWRRALSFCPNNELSALDQLSDRKPRVCIQLESKSKFTTWNGVWCEIREEIGLSSSILCWLVNQTVDFSEADRTAGGSRAFHLLPKIPRTHRRMQQVPTNAKLFEWEVHRRQCHFPSSDGSFYISIASQATAISAPQSQNKWCINNSGWMPRTLRDVSMSISSIIHTTEWSGENYRSQWCAIVLWKRDKET